MALSPRARIAAIGGALAIGVLGAGGVAYAAGGSGTPSYVTVVDDEGATTAPAAPERSADDCPEGAGRGDGSGPGPDSGTESGSGSATPGDA